MSRGPSSWLNGWVNSNCAVIKTHPGRSLNEILKETIEAAEGGEINCNMSPRHCQRQTVCCACSSFSQVFSAPVSAEVSPLTLFTRCLCVHVGNALAFNEQDGKGEGSFASSCIAPFGDPQTDYGVLLTQTNCLTVRSVQTLLWVSLAA